MAGGAASYVIPSVRGNGQHFAVVFTLYAWCLPETTPMLAARQEAPACARRTGCGCGDDDDDAGHWTCV